MKVGKGVVEREMKKTEEIYYNKRETVRNENIERKI